MGISEVSSPINRRSVSSNRLSPGARSNPSRASSDSVPEEKGQSTAQRRDQQEQEQEQEQEPQVHVHGSEETHVHLPDVEPDPEAKGDSLGVIQKLANPIMGRDRRAQSGYTFRNFPKD